MINQVNSGEVVMYSNSGSAISAGDIVVMGKVCGIAINDIAATTGVGAVAIKGCFRLTKKTAGDNIAQGTVLKYNSGVEAVSAAATLDAVIVGRAAAAAGTAATTVDVILGL